jgi:hypothetical protein
MAATPTNDSVIQGNSASGSKRKADDSLMSTGIEMKAINETKSEHNHDDEKRTSKCAISNDVRFHVSNAVMIHKGISCHECDVDPLIGIRYACSSCDGYDICESCHSDKKHSVDHLFIKVASAPISKEKRNKEVGSCDMFLSTNHKHPLIDRELLVPSSCMIVCSHLYFGS